MSKEHPTPWKVSFFNNLYGEPEYDDDMPILDADGKAVIITDSGVYPPGRATVEEIVAAVNAYKRPSRVCDGYKDAGEAEKAVLAHFEKHGMMAPQAQYWVERVTEFLFAEAGKAEGGVE